MNLDMTLRECLSRIKSLYEKNLIFKSSAIIISLSLVFFAGQAVGYTIGNTFSMFFG